MRLFIAKVYRIARHIPAEWKAFVTFPIVDRGAAFTAILSVIGLAHYLQSASWAETEVVLLDWLLWLRAFGIALAIWSVVGLLRAPFAVVAQDKEKGKWIKNHFIYHERKSVLIEIVPARGGATQAFEFVLDDAEPYAFAQIDIETDELLHNPGPSVVAFVRGGAVNKEIIVSEAEARLRAYWGRSDYQIDQRLNWTRKLTLYVRLSPEQAPKTFRLYCRGFYVGKRSDFDYRPT